jgi:RHS repeat-associated protein
VIDPLNNRTTFEYEPATGRKASETNALNNATHYAYDIQGRLTKTWGDAVYPVQYDYDTYGRRTAMHTCREGDGGDWPQGTGDVTIWVYDEPSGLLTSKVDAAGKAVTYTYQPEGKLATRTWARDNGAVVTTYNYNNATGELLNIDYADTTPDVSFTYDRLGRQETITDAVGTRTFAYNENLQLESETISGLYDRVITRAYETTGIKGRPIGFDLGADYAVDYDYDDYSRLNVVGFAANGVQDVAEYSYLANSNLLSGMTTGIGQNTTYTYEPKRNVKTSVENRFDGSLISRYDYAYDNLGRRTSVLNSGAAFATNAFNLYDYNSRNELTESKRYRGSNISDTGIPVNEEYRSYDYDSIGNREDATVGTTSQTYATNQLNQYTSIDIAGEVDEPVYDDDGNLKLQNLAAASGGGGPVQGFGGLSNFEYNAENRLVSIAPATPDDGDTKLSFVYDYMGRRVEKTASTYSGGNWTEAENTIFVYDGWNLIEETNDTETKHYVWGLDLSQSLQGAAGAGGLIASIDESGADYCQYDGNGNVGQLLDATGTLSARYEYDPYGNIKVNEEATGKHNPFRFGTIYWEDDVGLYFYIFRPYDPRAARWLSRDPVGLSGGLNLYGFVKNDPVDLIDLYGLSDDHSPALGILFELGVGFDQTSGPHFMAAVTGSVSVSSCDYLKLNGDVSIRVYNGGLGAPKSAGFKTITYEVAASASATLGYGQGSPTPSYTTHYYTKSFFDNTYDYSVQEGLSWNYNPWIGEATMVNYIGVKAANFYWHFYNDVKEPPFLGGGTDYNWSAGTSVGLYLDKNQGTIEMGFQDFTGTTNRRSENILNGEGLGDYGTWRQNAAQQDLNRAEWYLRYMDGQMTYTLSTSSPSALNIQNWVHDAKGRPRLAYDYDELRLDFDVLANSGLVISE